MENKIIKTDKRMNILLLLIVIYFLGGCIASKEVSITSSPAGADVFLDDEKKGVTPYIVRLEFPKSYPTHKVKVGLSGYEDSNFSIKYMPKTESDYFVNLHKKEIVYVTIVDFESVSVDGQSKLHKVTRKTLAYLETIERSSSVKTVQRVTTNGDTTFNISGPVLSPNGNILLYTIFETIVENGRRSEKSNIYMQNTNSKAVTSITKGNHIDLFPSYNGAGDFIYFSSNRTGISTIWKLRAEGGGGITSITSTSAEDIQPSMSPVGDWFAYTSNLPSASEPQIWTVNINGTLPTQLREGESPCVSPDGEKLVLSRVDKSHVFERNGKKYNPRQIWTMSRDGGSETQITQNVDYDITNPRWSPDGKWIIFSSDKGKDNSGRNNYDVWSIKSDGTNETQLTTNGSVDDYPFWGSDGFVYFRSNRGGYWNIWRVVPILPD